MEKNKTLERNEEIEMFKYDWNRIGLFIATAIVFIILGMCVMLFFMSPGFWTALGISLVIAIMVWANK